MASATTRKTARPRARGQAEPTRLARRLLAWYGTRQRRLPWRARPGERPDPYRVWLSEIMLQQTTVATVGPYFKSFVERWPDVHALARAGLDDVLHAWQGLGYYARARNLHRCARIVSLELGGRFPDTEEGLKMLPGIGRYTAAAIAAIAFGRRASAVDGNVERVIARFYGIGTPLPAAKPELAKRAARLVPEKRPGDFAQAMMDLGATICTPRRPRCALCPWRAGCRARALGIAENLPKRMPKPARPLRRGVAFWIVRRGAELLLQKRPPRGLLGGLMELPTTEWRAEPWPRAAALEAAPVRARWRALPGVVRHTFTHFELELTVLAARLERDDFGQEKMDQHNIGQHGIGRDSIGQHGIGQHSIGETTGRPLGVNEGQGPRWCRLDRLSDYALPSVMRKVVEHALANGG
ncbi:MAG TPA: A/G-specific adenine glycosylase [Alphaproteobacteria bacterium]|nr:A/G-specific adenine glycosylase [Alphaproteobacteria bacterium]